VSKDQAAPSAEDEDDARRESDSLAERAEKEQERQEISGEESPA
jgi:hypothetical protein